MAKILPSLVMVTLMTVLISWMLYGNEWTIYEIVLNCVGLSSTILRVPWYITFQYVCYFISYCIGKNRNRKIVANIMIGCSVCILIISSTFSCNSIGLHMWGLNSFSYAAGVILALYSAEIRIFINKISAFRSSLLLFGLFALFTIQFVLCYFILGNPQELYISHITKSLIAVTFCVFVYAISLFIEHLLNSKFIFLAKIGDISYEIYLIHGAIIYCFPETFVQNCWIALPIFLTGVYIISLWLNKMIGKSSISCQSGYTER